MVLNIDISKGGTMPLMYTLCVKSALHSQTAIFSCDRSPALAQKEYKIV